MGHPFVEYSPRSTGKCKKKFYNINKYHFSLKKKNFKHDNRFHIYMYGMHGVKPLPPISMVPRKPEGGPQA